MRKEILKGITALLFVLSVVNCKAQSSDSLGNSAKFHLNELKGGYLVLVFKHYKPQQNAIKDESALQMFNLKKEAERNVMIEAFKSNYSYSKVAYIFNEELHSDSILDYSQLKDLNGNTVKLAPTEKVYLVWPFNTAIHGNYGYSLKGMEVFLPDNEKLPTNFPRVVLRRLRTASRMVTVFEYKLKKNEALYLKK
jgi:hypothetical protein